MNNPLRQLFQDLHEIATPAPKATVGVPPPKGYAAGVAQKQAQAKTDLVAPVAKLTPVEALSMAQDPATPPETLKVLAAKFTKPASIRKALARNPNLDPDTLAAFAQSNPMDFLLNPGLPLIVLENPVFLTKLTPDTFSVVLTMMYRRQKKVLPQTLGAKLKSLSFTSLRKELLAKGTSEETLSLYLPKTLDLYTTDAVAAVHYPIEGVKAEPTFHQSLKAFFAATRYIDASNYERLADAA